MLDLVLQQLANGVSTGMVYALIALGLTVVFGVMHVINFAHGELYMVGALCSVLLTSRLGIPYIATLPIAAMAGALIAIVIDRIAISPVLPQKEGRALVLITTFAASMLINETVVASAGPGPIPSPGIGGWVLGLGPVALSAQRLLVISVGLFLVVLLQLMLMRTRFGQSLRAVAQSAWAAEVVGIDIRKVAFLTLALSGLLAGLAGALVVPIVTFSAAMGSHAVINAFVIVVIGSMGSFVGAVVCGIALGVSESIASIAMSSDASSAVIYSLLLLALLLRPQGLFARSAR